MKTPSYAGRLGAGDPCPLCGATSGVAEDAEGYSCLVCGAPRVLLDASVARSGAERTYLERARSLRRGRAVWAIFGGIAAVFGVGIGGLATIASLFIDYGTASRTTVGTLALIPIAFAVLAFWQSRRSAARARESMENAERAVVADVVRAQGAIDAEHLSRWMRIPAERARLLLADAQVESFLSPGGPGETRVRVAEDDFTVDESSAERRKREN